MSNPHQPPLAGGPPAGPVPAPLTVAAALVGLESLVLFGLGIVQVVTISQQRITMSVTTAFFFVGYAVFLGLCALLLSRLRSWVRAPVVLTQLIQLGLAWNLRDGETAIASAALSLVALVVLAGVLHPASLRALADEV